MRLFSYLLIVIGILMIVMNGLEWQYERPENNKGTAAFEVEAGKGDHIFWPSLAGSIILVSGVVLLVRKKRKAI